MADKPKQHPLVEVFPTREGDVSALASAHAPFIFFDRAAVCGYYNDILHVSLEVNRRMPAPDGESVLVDRVVVAHLRMSLEAAVSLRGAIDTAISGATERKAESKH